MWKGFTGIIADVYTHLERENPLAEEQKGCMCESCGTKDQLLIDRTVLRDTKRH